MKKLHFTLLAAAMMTLTIQQAAACTDIHLTAKDGTIMVARSMEFSVDFQSNLRSSPRDRQFTTTMGTKPSMSWQAKYGYLFVDGLNQDVALDGLNEMGLSIEALYLPGETKYQAVPAGKEAQGLPYFNFCDWILSNFKTIDEVKQALPNIYVFEQTIPGLGNMIFPLHFAIHDTTGKSIVVEFVNGQMNVMDNQVGVMTNSPTFDWQVTNLRNYLNLSPYSPSPITANGLTFIATGQGSGMVGLPGDVSPPSRFVKMSVMLKTAYAAADASGTLNLADHIMNNADIPAGFVRAVSNGKEMYETTEWVVFKDLTHKVFYYRTYSDLTLHGVDMSKINFSQNAPRLKMPLTSPPYIMDMTATFQKTVNS